MKNSKKFLIIAHRGASNLAPENTIKAFKMAIDLGADYIEFDVRQSADKEIIISHDNFILRTAHRIGWINRMQKEKLKSINLGNGEQIPTLNDLIKETKRKIDYMCEIKIKGISRKVADILKNQDILKSTILISFKHNELLKIKDDYPDLKLGAIIPTGFGWITSWFQKKKLISSISENQFYAINPFYKLVNKKLVLFAHKKGLKVFPWTINSTLVIEKLINMGVDGILTNNINRIKKILH